MRKTKIVCTLGPATDDDTILTQMIENGLSVARINFSHGSHEEHKVRADQVKRIREQLNLPVALLLDTKGPEVRIKDFEHGEVELKEGNQFVLTTEDVIGTEQKVSVTYKELSNDIDSGNTILIDDGLIELKVLSKTETEITCQILNGGIVKNKKGVNVPGVTVRLPFLSEIDKRDLLFGIENDFDFIGASFVRSYNDIKDMRKYLEQNNGQDIKIISKIENWDGVNNIDEILSISDGIMVARGDMGVEIPFEELPPIQKKLIAKAYTVGKPVITATQMLDSMIRNPRPTRAEITDVANAIYDGTSALMLSGETSIGKYPVEAVQTMSLIAEETERNIDYIDRYEKTHISFSRNVTNAISQATCTSAHTLNAAAIVTVTESGYTARMVSKYRPACPIIALVVSDKNCRQLAMTWGVHPSIMKKAQSTDELFELAIRHAAESPIIKNGDLIVITGGIPIGVSGTTNTVRIHIVGDVLVEGKGLNNISASGIVFVPDKNYKKEDQPKTDLLKGFSAGNILVIQKSTDEILTNIKHAAAVITEEEEEDCKAATVAKALEIPIIIGAKHATDILKSGIVVTADASKGLVFSGVK